MIDALEQRRERDGVVIKMVRPPVPAPSMAVLEALYAEAIGDRTRLVLVTHPSNLTGQYSLHPYRRRFEWIGTAPEYVNLAPVPALALHSPLLRRAGQRGYGIPHPIHESEYPAPFRMRVYTGEGKRA